MRLNYKVVRYPVSIHAPVKGATEPRKYTWIVEQVSIHAPVKGATRANFSVACASEFQFTHP